MPDAIFQLPLGAAGLLIIGCLCVYSMAGLLVVRRFILPRPRVSAEESNFTGAIVQAVMVFVIGLIITSIFAFERPFAGELGIDPAPYRLIHDQLMTN